MHPRARLLVAAALFAGCGANQRQDVVLGGDTSAVDAADDVPAQDASPDPDTASDASYPIRSHLVDGRTYFWVIGQDWDVWGQRGSLVTDAGPAWLTALVWGTDLGINVRFRGRRIIYFGDTWRFEGGRRQTERWCDAACTDRRPAANCAQCDDALALSSDADPSDGLNLDSVPSVLETDDAGAPIRRHLPITLPGVHSDMRQQDIWGSVFNVPAGAVAIRDDAGEAVLLWYATSMLENGGLPMRSWLGRSRDGTTFENCLPPGGSGPAADRYLPFSQGPAPTGRFINVAAIEVGDHRLEGCDPPPFRAERGLLLFGAGTPYRRSDVYLAYAPLDRVCSRRCQGDDCDHRWVAYYTGRPGAACWSSEESDAAPLLGTVREVPVAGGDTVGVGELSVVAVQGLGFVMLSTEAWCASPDGCSPGDYARGVVLRWAPAQRPWSFSAPIATGAAGYGPYVLDGHTHWDQATRTLRLWHFASTWLGGNDTAYGVQLTRTEVVLDERR